MSSCRVHDSKGWKLIMTIQELEQVIACHGRDIYSFCLRLTGNKMLADELYQDTFLKATEKMSSLTVAEVAKVMSIPSGTVKSRLSVARKRLEVDLEGYYRE